MRFPLVVGLAILSASSFARTNLVEQITVTEEVYVEAPTDTDSDGKLDRIYVSVDRPSGNQKFSTIFYISPYAQGGNDGPMHEVDSDLLPQDEAITKDFSDEAKAFISGLRKSLKNYEAPQTVNATRYARVSAHSVGTGKSTGCPTVGDMSETLAAKSVIDWLNGRAKASYANGKEAVADWANGKVGMTGTSYDGTLPIMVATTGVAGLKAIVPVAAISNWYNYYRANGLVTNPGGYIGEDADVLGYFIMRKGDCKTELDRLTQTMGRETGDFTKFWQDRDYLPNAKNVKAATFIIHGQSDWNVKQKHAIEFWEALDGVVPRRIFLHKGGHGSTYAHNVPSKLQMWFDHFLEGDDNGIEKGPQVEVELPDGSLMVQNEWPHETAKDQRLYFGGNDTLSASISTASTLNIVDSGKSTRLESLSENPNQKDAGRLLFLTAPLTSKTVLTGTSKVTLNFSLKNRKAANLTVAVVEYDNSGKARIITRGWADAQNHSDITQGELLIPGMNYQITFDLEPKQYRVAKGNRIGIMLASTDYAYTLRPKEGTEIQFNLGQNSFIDLKMFSEP